MSENFNVLMMGGHRCGKTSILASMFDQMRDEPVKDYFTVTDRTVPEIKNGEMQESLSDKTLELQNMLESNQFGSHIFLVDHDAPSNCFWQYKLHLQKPGKNLAFDITVTDTFDGAFEPNGLSSQRTRELVENTDIFIIAIDTPFLMASKDPQCSELCPEIVNKMVNRIEEICYFLTYINIHDGEDAKMVIFVPLKCEKWAKEGKLEEVARRVEEVYEPHITALKRYTKINVGIIPVQTCGNIIFKEFSEPLIYDNGRKSVPCCRVNEGIILKENGELDLANPDDVHPNTAYCLGRSGLLRPYSWFFVTPDNNNFEPENGDQLALHIIRFLLEKYKSKNIGSIFSRGKAEEAQQLIDEMRVDGIIKDDSGGIKII